MSNVFARKALLESGWAADVRIILDGGRIGAVETGTTSEPGDCIAGIVIPGLCNAHSHAFQRALAGRTEVRSPKGDDTFWTWRDRMYALAARLDGETLSAIASQAYSEMIASGFTSVVEFHYLLSDPALVDAIFDAAERAGIRLTFIPVLYERAGFDKQEPEGHQRLFAQKIDRFVDAQRSASERVSERINVGIGAHSLRAVCPESLAALEAIASEQGIPMHLHIAEQQREVDQCLASYGRRPVRWLLENMDVRDNWCLVHATHMDEEESQALAESTAVVCLCPSTEANLGDGLFRLYDFVNAGGEIAIGSDSHVSINPFEELRWLEYGQRLVSQSRNIVALGDAHVGRELFHRVLRGGEQAGGLAGGGLGVGKQADLVVLYDDDPMLAGHEEDYLLDALVFSGYRFPVDRVMVHGAWQVIDGEHIGQQEIRSRFADALRKL